MFPDAFQVDDAVAHHAAVEQHVAGRHQPVADVMGEDALLRAGARDLRGQIGVPPQVINVDGYSGARAKARAHVEGLA